MMKRLGCGYVQAQEDLQRFGDRVTDHRTGEVIQIKQENGISLFDFTPPRSLYWDEIVKLFKSNITGLTEDGANLIQQFARNGNLFVVRSNLFSLLNDLYQCKRMTHPIAQRYITELFKSSGWEAVLAFNGELSCDGYVFFIKDLSSESATRFVEMMCRDEAIVIIPLSGISIKIVEIMNGQKPDIKPDIVESVSTG